MQMLCIRIFHLISKILHGNFYKISIFLGALGTSYVTFCQQQKKCDLGGFRAHLGEILTFFQDIFLDICFEFKSRDFDLLGLFFKQLVQTQALQASGVSNYACSKKFFMKACRKLIYKNHKKI